MHGFPDNTHLYDRLLPHLAGRRPVVRFDFLGWGRSDKPAGYPYTAANQAGGPAPMGGNITRRPSARAATAASNAPGSGPSVS